MTIVDLHARKLEQTRAAIEDLLAAGALDDYRVVVDQPLDVSNPSTSALVKADVISVRPSPRSA